MAEVASAFVSLVPSAKGFGKGISNQIGGDVDRAGVDGGKRFGKGMSTGMAGIGARMFAPLAAAAAAVGIGSFLKDAVAGASDLGESASKVGVVFGKKFAPQIVAASKTAAKGMGLSQNAYLAATGSLGNLLVSLDIAPKKSAAMSQSMVKLAGDLASFNNVAPEEALAALQSGLTGETEPLKRFGVNMNDATLKAQALKMGLIKTTKDAMSPQTKALAAQALIMAQTGTAQGDFARTSGGLANQQRILAARADDLKTKIGGFLLPVVTKFVTFLNNGMGPVAKFGEALRAGFSGDTSSFTGILGIVAKVGNAFGVVVDAAKVFFSFLNGNDTGVDGPFREMAVAGEAARGVIATLVGFFQTQLVPAFQQAATFIQTQVVPAFMGIVTAIQGYVSVALPIVQAFVTGMMARIQPMIPTIMAIFATIGQIIVAAMGLIQAVIQRVTTIISFIWTNWGGSIMSFITGVWSKMLVIIQAALAIIQGVIKTVTSIIKGDWSGAWDGIKQILSGVWNAIKGIISAALNIIGGIMSAAWALMKTGATAGWGKILDFIKSIPGKITTALGNVGSLLYNKGREIIQGLIDGIKDMVGNVGSAMGDVMGKIADFLPGSPVKKGPLRVLNNGYAGKQIVKMLAGGIDSQRFSLASSLDSLMSGPAIQAAPRLDFASVSGGGGAAVIDNSIILDGEVLFRSMRTVSMDGARRNGMSGFAS